MSASRPFAAVSTARPAASSPSDVTSRIEGSSSTRSTRSSTASFLHPVARVIRDRDRPDVDLDVRETDPYGYRSEAGRLGAGPRAVVHDTYASSLSEACKNHRPTRESLDGTGITDPPRCDGCRPAIAGVVKRVDRAQPCPRSGARVSLAFGLRRVRRTGRMSNTG